MTLKKIIGLILLIVIAGKSYCQDTLPRFTFVERGERVVISWTNPYDEKLIQLNVQRSYDSLRNYSTIFSAITPELPQNGYTDKKPIAPRVYYRIFYVIEGGSYFFTLPTRAGMPPDNYYRNDNNQVGRDINSTIIDQNSSKIISIKIKNTVRQLPAIAFRNFKDSILRATRDTLIAINDTLIILNPYVAKDVWRPSFYIYINRDGYINISLPLVQEKKYYVKFFEEDGTPLFELKTIKETPLILDKTSFIHSGWFSFEIYEDNRLKEKNKIFIPRDF